MGDAGGVRVLVCLCAPDAGMQGSELSPIAAGEGQPYGGGEELLGVGGGGAAPPGGSHILRALCSQMRPLSALSSLLMVLCMKAGGKSTPELWVRQWGRPKTHQS